MFAAVNVACQEQDAAGRRENEDHANDRFLNVGPSTFGPCQQQCTRKGSDECGDLDSNAFRLEADMIGEEDAASGDLRNGEVDKNDAASENLRSERDMR